MKFKDMLLEAIGSLFVSKDDEVPKKDIINTTVIVDSELPEAMIAELSNGKGDDD